MKKKFNLSEKLRNISWGRGSTANGICAIDIQDVKEFIKIFIKKCKCKNCRDLIRELAGEDLI